MTAINLAVPIFNSEESAREHLEAIRWPNGPLCPHCGEAKPVTRLHRKTTRRGLFQYNSCREHFTVTVGSVMERSHIPLTKWILGFHLMGASKKGISTSRLHRMLGIQYKSAWYMAHRIREAMREGEPNQPATPTGAREQKAKFATPGAVTAPVSGWKLAGQRGANHSPSKYARSNRRPSGLYLPPRPRLIPRSRNPRLPG